MSIDYFSQASCCVLGVPLKDQRTMSSATYTALSGRLFTKDRYLSLLTGYIFRTVTAIPRATDDEREMLKSVVDGDRKGIRGPFR